MKSIYIESYGEIPVPLPDRQLATIFQHLFNLSLSLERGPLLWKTSSLVPVPKKSTSSSISDCCLFALPSQVINVLERLVLDCLRPLVNTSQDTLKFAYQPHLGVDDAVIHLLQRSHTHLDGGGGCL